MLFTSLYATEGSMKTVYISIASWSECFKILALTFRKSTDDISRFIRCTIENYSVAHLKDEIS